VAGDVCEVLVAEKCFLLRLEKVMFCVLKELGRFLNWHLLRLAAAAARAFSSPCLELVRRPNEVDRPQVLARSSSENPPDLSIAQGGAKSYWPRDQFLRGEGTADRPESVRRVKMEK